MVVQKVHLTAFMSHQIHQVLVFLSGEFSTAKHTPMMATRGASTDLTVAMPGEGNRGESQGGCGSTASSVLFTRRHREPIPPPLNACIFSAAVHQIWPCRVFWESAINVLHLRIQFNASLSLPTSLTLLIMLTCLDRHASCAFNAAPQCCPQLKIRSRVLELFNGDGRLNLDIRPVALSWLDAHCIHFKSLLSRRKTL